MTQSLFIWSRVVNVCFLWAFKKKRKKKKKNNFQNKQYVNIYRVKKHSFSRFLTDLSVGILFLRKIKAIFFFFLNFDKVHLRNRKVIIHLQFLSFKVYRNTLAFCSRDIFSFRRIHVFAGQTRSWKCQNLLAIFSFSFHILADYITKKSNGYWTFTETQLGSAAVGQVGIDQHWLDSPSVVQMFSSSVWPHTPGSCSFTR